MESAYNSQLSRILTYNCKKPTKCKTTLIFYPHGIKDADYKDRSMTFLNLFILLHFPDVIEFNGDNTITVNLPSCTATHCNTIRFLYPITTLKLKEPPFFHHLKHSPTFSNSNPLLFGNTCISTNTNFLFLLNLIGFNKKPMKMTYYMFFRALTNNMLVKHPYSIGLIPDKWESIDNEFIKILKKDE